MAADIGIRGQAVRCEDLSRTFTSPAGSIAAVDATDVTFAAGQTTALVGPSGCGKSTLLRLIAGLEAPTTGTVRIGDETPAQTCQRGALAVAFQDASLLPWRTLRGNIALALTLARRPADPDRVDRLIAKVGLQGFEDRRPAELSGGMRQRAAIARCLVGDPELLLLDEPFGAVDELTRRRLNYELPKLWQANGTTALLVTHSVTEAVLVADRVLVMSPRPGRIVADIDIDLPQPRTRGLESETAFRTLTATVAEALMDIAPPRQFAAQ
ncbi:ABC transporter ATP-binding protein [Oceaniglobus indicus]|uniref:ABC transporter ATP-binding protein n=1 Tax=Oceaniglobus indicus TaxID=2047749 RepID=UPI000C1746D9|nr:ABC transporter ATP-binding protein [Oceaniglobus indicus]